MEPTAKRGRDRKAVKVLSASFASLLLLAGCAGVTQPPSVSDRPHVEGCLAGFCLNKAKTIESEVIAKLGEGYTRRITPAVGDIVHCYFDPTQEIWIEFTFDHHHQSRQLLQVFASSTEPTPIPRTPGSKNNRRSFLPHRALTRLRLIRYDAGSGFNRVRLLRP